MPNEAALYTIGIIELRLCHTIYTCIPLWYKPENWKNYWNKQALKYNFIDSTIALNLAF
jgi:hypothetical protein